MLNPKAKNVKVSYKQHILSEKTENLLKKKLSKQCINNLVSKITCYFKNSFYNINFLFLHT